MTDATLRPCPPWCSADHGTQHVEDWAHEAEIVSVPVVTGISAADLLVSVRQRLEDDEPIVRISLEHQAITLTVGSAARLRRAVGRVLQDLGLDPQQA